MRESSRTKYDDINIIESTEFQCNVSSRNIAIFSGWVGGATGKQLSERYNLSQQSIRHILVTLKRKYDSIKMKERYNYHDN